MKELISAVFTGRFIESEKKPVIVLGSVPSSHRQEPSRGKTLWQVRQEPSRGKTPWQVRQEPSRGRTSWQVHVIGNVARMSRH